jgi:molecular chaperone DnaJ
MTRETQAVIDIWSLTMQGQSKDIHTTLGVTLDDAVRGLSTMIEVERLESCPDCQGSGIADGDRSLSCQSCHGSGQVAQQRMVEIQVPAGVDQGCLLRIPGEGHAGLRGDPAGNLYLIVSLQNHP